MLAVVSTALAFAAWAATSTRLKHGGAAVSCQTDTLVRDWFDRTYRTLLALTTRQRVGMFVGGRGGLIASGWFSLRRLSPGEPVGDNVRVLRYRLRVSVPLQKGGVRVRVGCWRWQR